MCACWLLRGHRPDVAIPPHGRPPGLAAKDPQLVLKDHGQWAARAPRRMLVEERPAGTVLRIPDIVVPVVIILSVVARPSPEDPDLAVESEGRVVVSRR